MSDSEVCGMPSFNTNFFVNSVLHILILLIIVSSFFFFFVSGLSRDKFKDELKNLVTDNLTPALKAADKDGVLKTTLQQLDLPKITTYYQTTKDEASTIQNSWLKKVTLMIILMLILTIIMTLVILKQSCNKCVPFSEILKENAILFLFVGMVEVSFFLIIAKNFVPVKPSLMMNTILSSLKSSFK